MTIQFVGSRLREAREARGISASALSELIAVTSSAVSQYETGHRVPSDEVLMRICSGLNFPPQFFARAEASPAVTKTFWRSMSAATKKARIKARHRLEWGHSIARYLEEFIDLPIGDLGDSDLPNDPNLIHDRSIDAEAERVRRTLGLSDGPIKNITWLMENNGVFVSHSAFDTVKLDALSGCDDDGRIFMVLNKDKCTAVRWRFDVAHELGHYVLHRRLDEQSCAKNHSLIEKQAHRFAAAFLLPAQSFMDDFFSTSLDSLVHMKEKWLTSVRTIIIRAEQLDLIDRDRMTSLFVACSRRKWTTKEPLDDVLKPEQPLVLKRSFELLINERIQSRERILASLPLAPRDVEEMAGLPFGFLASEPEVIPFEPRLRSTTGEAAKVGTATVVQFPTRPKA